MKTGDAVREVMKLKNIRVNQLSDRLGKSPRLVSERLGQKNISVLKLSEMLRVMDYKILIVPRNVQIKNDWYELTVNNEPSKLNLDELLSDPAE